VSDRSRSALIATHEERATDRTDPEGAYDQREKQPAGHETSSAENLSCFNEIQQFVKNFRREADFAGAI
jgi:hypothetical protein